MLSDELRNAENYFGPPVISGSYDGSKLALPMKGLTPARPVGSPVNIDPNEFRR